MSAFDETDMLCVNTIRTLSADVIQKAKSGHPGMPMGMAPIAHVVWDRVMNYSPAHPKWANRDRFVLSNGHGCALLYTMLHLSGYDLSMDDLKQFRQINSKTPGHPECFVTAGCEVTTGPLGQGIANAAGFALCEANMRATYNKPGFNLFDHYTYVFCGDGCLQEGVSGEASSLAGHWGLGKLIVFYDDNKITIDGDTSLSFSEDVPARYRSYGWHTLTVEKGDANLDGILEAVAQAKAVTDKPTLISVKTIIGFGSEKQGLEECHGSPLGDKDIANVKTKFGLDPTKSFHVTAPVLAKYGAKPAKGAALVTQWTHTLAGYAAQYPKEAAELQRRLAGKLPQGWEQALPVFDVKAKGDATRNLSGKCLNALAAIIPEMVGGSADLTPSNKTAIKGAIDFQKDSPQGRYIRFGVREHGMAAICNGISAYGGYVPFSATFLNFIEYAYGAVRLSALSGHQQLYIMTHDSIGLGEDGPTHQPIEAVQLCRATPNMLTFRPADGNEVSGAYCAALNFQGPSVLCLSRQGMPTLALSSIEKTLKGGYVALECSSKPELILVATGSEVGLALDAAAKLGGQVRVVSMPCTELFDQQSVEYRRSVLTPGVPTVAIEALTTSGWEKYSHFQIGMTTFGASAPIKALMKKFGFTPDQVVAKCQKYLADSASELSAMGVGALSALPTHFSSAPVLRSHL